MACLKNVVARFEQRGACLAKRNGRIAVLLELHTQASSILVDAWKGPGWSAHPGCSKLLQTLTSLPPVP
jgi:hypothetical protein